MGIRTYQKDHTQDLAQSPVIVPELKLPTGESRELLRFWTSHPTAPVLVDLTEFSLGRDEPAGKRWAGPFSGRPKLIQELAPGIHVCTELMGQFSVQNIIAAIRAWWRLFDSVEAAASLSGTVRRVESVADITAVHHLAAFNRRMTRLHFTNFIRVVNLVRKTRKLPQLYWDSPAEKGTKRHLPPKWAIDEIRVALKREWVKASARWEHAERLLAGDLPVTAENAFLLKNLLRFSETAERTGKALPDNDEIRAGVCHKTFQAKGFNLLEMSPAFFPDSQSIRAAFHLCLANTGWNAAVLLGLDADKTFIEPHPKDPNRYILCGFKNRGKSEVFSDGLYAAKTSPGVILQSLVERTAPLRKQLKARVEELRAKYAQLQGEMAASKVLDALKQEIIDTEYGSHSPWVFVHPWHGHICWLTDRNYANVGGKSVFLEELIAAINKRLPQDKQISVISASDFRDAYAAYAYEKSGGMVLFVMRVLGQKKPNTTQRYLDNTLLNQQGTQLYHTFSNALWSEIRATGRVDPSILAKISRDGSVSSEERKRLDDYRALKRSRLGVGCKNPTKPPKHIAPTFRPDGKSCCPVQRCLICLEHAVIFPDSLDGLCKRLAELRHLQLTIPIVAFVESRFGEELENTELALNSFDPEKVEVHVDAWAEKINRGEHRVITLDGRQRVYV